MDPRLRAEGLNLKYIQKQFRPAEALLIFVVVVVKGVSLRFGKINANLLLHTWHGVEETRFVKNASF